jgi:hypothetical protein
MPFSAIFSTIDYILRGIMQYNQFPKGLSRKVLKTTAVSLVWAISYIGVASAQSLNPNQPVPLQAGVNSSVADSFIGSHFYYFVAGPGEVKVTISFSSMGLYGNPTKATIGVYLYDEKGNAIAHRDLTSSGSSKQLILSINLKREAKLKLRIQPPANSLLRAGGNYDVEVTGAVTYDNNTASDSQDPIVKTYQLMRPVTGLFEGGAAKFYSDGSLKLGDGNTGTWKLFDTDSKIYIVTIKGYNFNVKLRPGIGLVDTRDTSSITFKEVR